MSVGKETTLLEEIAGYSLNYKPTNSEFIDMLAYYLLEMEESESA